MTIQLLSFMALSKEWFRYHLIAMALMPLKNRYGSTKCQEGGDRLEINLLKKDDAGITEGHREKNTLFTLKENLC
jgi:hypothetical protein